MNPNTMIEILTVPKNYAKLDPNEACYIINARIAFEECNNLMICTKISKRVEEIMDKHNLRPMQTLNLPIIDSPVI